MLAAVHATEEQLIAFQYMIQISALLAFFLQQMWNVRFIKKLVAILHASQSESELYLFFAHKNTTTAHCSLREDFSGNIVVFNVYKWRHSDIIIIELSYYSELNSPQNVYFGFFISGKLT